MEELDLDLRIPLLRPQHQFADAQHGRIEDRAELEVAGRLAAQVQRGMFQVLHRADDLLGLGEEAPPRRRQRHSRRRPLEQRNAELLLQRLDVAGHCRLAQMEGLGRARQMSRLRDGDERTQVVEVHVNPACLSPRSGLPEIIAPHHLAVEGVCRPTDTRTSFDRLGRPMFSSKNCTTKVPIDEWLIALRRFRLEMRLFGRFGMAPSGILGRRLGP